MLQQASETVAQPDKKRPRPDVPTESTPASKAMKDGGLATSATDGCKDVPLTQDGMLRCAVREFKGKTYVDLRRFYMVRKPCTDERCGHCQKSL